MTQAAQSTQTSNFSGLPSEIQKAPQSRRTEVLIEGIATQMQQSGNQETKQLGSELHGLKNQLVKACQQQS